MSISSLAMKAKQVIEAAWLHGPSYDLASQAAYALESAQLLQSPETAAEHAHYRSAFEAQRSRAETLDGLLRTAQDRVAELETEREKLARWHGEDSKTINRLVARVERRQAELVALRNDALSMRGSLAPADGDRKVPFELGGTLTPAVDWLIARVAELEAAQGTVYRAEHPDSGITLGHYATEAAARAHCEAEERRAWPTGTTLAFDWIEDDEDRVAELVVTAGQNEESTTGYIVTALELDSEYDPDGDA